MKYKILYCLPILLFAILVGCGGNSVGEKPVIETDLDLDDDTVVNSEDCAPEDSSRWRLIQYTSADLDNDEFRIAFTDTVCSGEALPLGYYNDDTSITSPDCDDSNSNIWRNVVIYEDVDNDGVGSGIGNVSCIGLNANSGYSLLGYDPLDTIDDANSTLISDFDLPVSITTYTSYLAEGDD